MIVLAIQHRVRDYDAWKAVFDTFPPIQAGALFHRVNRAVDDPNLVTVVCGWPTPAEAKGFTTNPELAAKMEESGVVGEPRIEMYEETEAKQRQAVGA